MLRMFLSLPVVLFAGGGLMGGGFVMEAVAAGGAVGSVGSVADEGRPNVVFILSDDHRFDSMGCAGHPILKTPFMDELARKGVRFSNMFVTTSICAASRATILTGMHERKHRYTFGTKPMRAQVTNQSYPVLMRKAGYKTGFVGKFGVNAGRGYTQEAFDYFKSLHRAPYFKKQKDGSLRHLSEITGDHAIEFLKGQKDGGPFCLSISFNAVHAEDGDKENHFPWPKAVDGMYEDVEIPNPKYDSAEVFAAHPEFMKASMNRIRFFWRWDTPEKYQKNIRAYFRMISGMDRVIGRVMKALEENGLAENTVVIFTGDNGYYQGNRGFAGKWSHYEESLRVPLIIYDPRVAKEKRGRVLEQMVLNVDLAPTMVDLAGIEVPDQYTGRSLVPLLRGENPDDWRKAFFCEHLMHHRDIPKWEGIRTGRYVYARYFEQDPPYEYLHDLKKDPDQLTNFAGHSEYKQVLNRLRNRTDKLRDDYGGPYDLELFTGRKPKK